MLGQGILMTGGWADIVIGNGYRSRFKVQDFTVTAMQ
jgi:hypothetical protein